MIDFDKYSKPSLKSSTNIYADMKVTGKIVLRNEGCLAGGFFVVLTLKRCKIIVLYN